jgi:hypothetical protein
MHFFLLTRRRLGLFGASHPRQPTDTSRKRDHLSHSRQRKDMRSKVSASLISAPGAGHPFVFLGRQASAGIARLHQLRNGPNFAAISAVWPFETDWAMKAKWLPKHVSILHAEIYPSVRSPMPDEIKDRGQVRAMWQWARDLDCDDLLWREFCRPIEIAPGSKEDMAIQLTEGWILGCSPTATNQ